MNLFIKIITLVTICTSINAKVVDLTEKKEFSNLIYTHLSDLSNTLDKDLISEWFLSRYNLDIYKKVKNDEFEFESTKEDAYETLKELGKKYNDAYKTSNIFTSTIQARFGKYDFKQERFPIKLYDGITTRGFPRMIKSSPIIFTNNIKNKHFFNMNKSNAKVFIKKRKKSSGDVERKVLAKYFFKIKKVMPVTKLTEKFFKEGIRSFYSNDAMKIKVTAKIVKIEIGTKDGQLLDTIIF